MPYSATFRHIDSDFEFTKLEFGTWNAEYEDEQDLIDALNRVAFASSRSDVVEFPEVDVCQGVARATIRAINGQLYYTDANSQNRKDIKVTAEEVGPLMSGKSLAGVRQRDEAEEMYVPPSSTRVRSSQGGWLTQVIALVIMLVVLSFCTQSIWENLSDAPRLHIPPQFDVSLSQESDFLRQYADVYVSEYREGAMLFELTREGQFSRYEMWFSAERDAFVIVPVDTYAVQVGQHGGHPAMLANRIYLLLPKGDETIELHRVQYTRHHGKLADIGEIVERDGDFL
jgi:hypothetical protein